METRECVVHGWSKERRKLTQHCEDRGHCEHKCGVRRLPLLMIGDFLGFGVVWNGLGVAVQFVPIVEDSRIDLLLVYDVELDDVV